MARKKGGISQEKKKNECHCTRRKRGQDTHGGRITPRGKTKREIWGNMGEGESQDLIAEASKRRKVKGEGALS